MVHCSKGTGNLTTCGTSRTCKHLSAYLLEKGAITGDFMRSPVGNEEEGAIRVHVAVELNGDKLSVVQSCNNTAIRAVYTKVSKIIKSGLG